MLDRHDLVAGATGTTETLQLMAEQLSAAGVPAFLPDVEGDVAGVAVPGTPSERLSKRGQEAATAWSPQGFPVELLSLGGLGRGVPVRAGVTSSGPVLLSEVLDLGATQPELARAGVPPRGQPRPRARRPGGPARRHHAPHERRGQRRPGRGHGRDLARSLDRHVVAPATAAPDSGHPLATSRKRAGRTAGTSGP